MESDRDYTTALDEPQIDFYYSSFEEQLRNDLNDSKARLIPSKTEGRIILEIEEVLLDDFMERLLSKEDNSWSNGKKLMQGEMHGMKAQRAQANHVPSSEMEKLKAQLRESSEKLQKAQRDLEQQTSLLAQLERMKGKNEDLHGNLEKVKGENRDLHAKLENKMSENEDLVEKLREKSEENADLLAKLEKMGGNEDQNTEDKGSEDNHQENAKVKNLFQGCIEANFKKAVKEKAQLQVELENMKVFNGHLQANLSKVMEERQQLLSHLERAKVFQGHFEAGVKALGEKQHLQVQLEKVQKENEELQLNLKKSGVMKEYLEKSQKSHQPQLEELRAELKMYSTALEDKEDLLQKERLHWQKEKTALLETQEALKKTVKEMEEARKNADAQNVYLQQRVFLLKESEKSGNSFAAQLKEEKLKNSTLAADLKKAEQVLQTQRSNWQQEKSSLSQRIDAVLSTVIKSKSSYQALQEEHKAQNAKLADLKRVEAQLEQKISQVEEMEKSREEETQKNNTLVAALTKASELLETNKIQQEEEISTLHQVIESLKKCLQEKKQECEENESAMRSQLEDLQDQLSKKKKKKWYKKLF